VTRLRNSRAPFRIEVANHEERTIVPPMLWLASTRADGVTGKRVVANRWRDETPDDAIEDAGCSS
jgi:hypothetical protein